MGKYGYNHGDFGWNELSVKDPQASVAFYTELFGWKVEEIEMPDGVYHVLISGEEKVGGINAATPEQHDSPSSWMPYITVDDVDALAAKIEALGGKIIVPPCDIPVEDSPRFTIFQDNAGATLGAITYQNAPEA